LSPDYGVLYVVHRDADKIVAIDTADWSILGEIATPGEPVRCGVNSDGTMVAYALFGGQAVGFANVTSMEEVGRVATVGPMVSLELTADRETALSCAQDQHTCYMLSVPERSITNTIHVKDGAGPDPMLLLEP
jgi:hypothetical protein